MDTGLTDARFFLSPHTCAWQACEKNGSGDLATGFEEFHASGFFLHEVPPSG
jgi:hypothetical protein